MSKINKDLQCKSETQIINDFYFILQFAVLDQDWLRQYCAFFTDIHWKLIACCQRLSDNFILEFRKHYEKIYNCDDFRALKKKIRTAYDVTYLKNGIDD